MPSGDRRVDYDERGTSGKGLLRFGAYFDRHGRRVPSDFACDPCMSGSPSRWPTLASCTREGCLRGCFASVYLPRDRSLTGRVISRETSCRRKQPNLVSDFTRIARGNLGRAICVTSGEGG